MAIIEVNVTELEAALATGARVVDVRESNEYIAGHVPGAVHMPLSTVPENIGAFQGDGATYVVCHSGGRSRRVCEFLEQQGLQAVNVAGGTGEWINSGRAVVAGSTPS